MIGSDSPAPTLIIRVIIITIARTATLPSMLRLEHVEWRSVSRMHEGSAWKRGVELKLNAYSSSDVEVVRA